MYNKFTHLVLRTRQIEHILNNENKSLRSRKMISKCGNCAKRRARFKNSLYDIFSMFLAKHNENDAAMFIITSPVDNSK